jgi:hypothetical protein
MYEAGIRTQAEAARVLGIGKNHAAALYHGRRPSLTVRMAMSAALLRLPVADNDLTRKRLTSEAVIQICQIEPEALRAFTVSNSTST